MRTPSRSRAAGAPPPLPPRTCHLRLYVAGRSPRSLRALRNLERLCESRLLGRHRITVIDLLEHPRRARRDQILAVPTVVRLLPKPSRRVIGDLSDLDLALAGLYPRKAP